MIEKSVVKYQAPALSRGLKILEVLSSTKEPKTLNQIAKALEVSNSQVFRLLYVLVENGYVNKDSSDKFQISSKLFSVGIQYVTNYSFVEIVSPVLKEISEKTKQSCHCSIRVDDKMVVVVKVDSPCKYVFSTKVGYSKNLENSTSGKVILAHLDEQNLSPLMKKIEKVHSKAFVKELLENLETIREQQYLMNPSIYVEGIEDIAVPVVPRVSHIGPFSIVIPYVNNLIDNSCSPESALEILKKGAEQIAEIMI